MEYLYQLNVVHECLRAQRRPVLQLLIARDTDAKAVQPILRLAETQRVRVQTTTQQQLTTLTRGAIHQGVALQVGPYPYVALPDLLTQAMVKERLSLFLLLDLVQSPSNVGRLLRSAEAFGVSGVVLPERRAASIDANVAAASMGASEHLLVAQVVNLVQAMQTLKEHEIWLAGLDLDRSAQPLTQVKLDLPLGIVVGNEGSGLRPLVRKTCDFLISIPMYGQVDSLNASVAGSIVLYQARQQRTLLKNQT